MHKEYKVIGVPSNVSYDSLPEVQIAVYYDSNKIEESGNGVFPYEVTQDGSFKISVTGLGGFILTEITSLCGGMYVVI